MISKTHTALCLLTLCCVTSCFSQKAAEPVPEKALKVSLNHINHDGFYALRRPPIHHQYKAALIDGMKVVEGRTLQVFPRRLELENGTVIQGDPKRLEASLKAVEPYLDFGDAFEPRITDTTGLIQGRFQEKDSVAKVELEVLDLGLSGEEKGRVMEQLEPSFDQKILAAMLTDIDTPAAAFQRSRVRMYYTKRDDLDIRTVHRQELLPDGSVTSRVDQIMVVDPYIPPPLVSAYTHDPERTSQALTEIAATTVYKTTNDAARHFIYLRPKGERSKMSNMKWNKKAFDEVDEENGTSPRQALVAEMKRITQEQFGR